MKKEQDVIQIFSEWFSGCDDADEVRRLYGVITDAAELERENRLFDLKREG